MLHLKLYPENAIYIPGKRFKNELQEIINDYLQHCNNLPDDLNDLSFDDEYFDETLDKYHDFIEDASFDGDVRAEKTLRALEDILDNDDFPNYFVIRSDLNANKIHAEKGDIYSQGMLGDRYYYGKGVKQNYKKAFEWYMKAAKCGVREAQYNVGGCYELGRGTEMDIDKAIFWYTKAAELGLEEAKRNLVRIELQKSNTQEDITSYLPSYVWEGERETAIKDEFGVEYSADGKRLLYAPEDIEHYVIKDGTQVICDCAFGRCENLSSITIPEGVSVIGSYSFGACEKLESIQLPKTTREISERAFEWTGIESIEIPDNVIYIGERAFCECESLASIKIGKNVSEIRNEILVWNKNLTSIEVDPENQWFDSRNNCNAIIETKTNRLIACCNCTEIPDSVSSIGKSAFWGTKLKTITIPGSVETIAESAFFKCEDLETVIIQDGVKFIGKAAFEECTNLKTVKLPETLIKIKREAFFHCDNLNSIKLPDSIERLEDIFFNLTSPNIPKSIKKIGMFVFCNCRINTEIIIPEGVKIISKSAFRFVLATKITIPKSVEYIGKEAFYGCKNLETVILLNPNTEIEKDAFANCQKLKDISFRNN